MKPTVPETGRVIKLSHEDALVMMEGSRSCKGCGAAKIGLCRSGGSSMFLTAKNSVGAVLGDYVTVGIDRETHFRGYLFAYIIPLSAFLTGAVLGNFLGNFLDIPQLDTAGAFLLLALASWISFGSLRKLDKSGHLVIKRIMSDIGYSSGLILTDDERAYKKRYNY